MPMQGLVLLTGTTGSIGGRLLTLLQKQGIRVRCLTRRPEALSDGLSATTEIVHGDVLHAQSLNTVFEGVDTAYYFGSSAESVGE